MVICLLIALGSILLRKHKLSVNSVICCKFSPLNNSVTFFPIQMHRRPNLPSNRSRSTYGPHLYFLEIEKSMLHAKFQNHRTSGSGEEDVGHVTWTIYSDFCFHFPWRFHMKFGFDRPLGFRAEDL